MKTIQTVLGPIRPEQMKACLPHEHFTVYGPNHTSIEIQERACEVIVPELQELRRRFNCNTLVECTNCASTGRDVETYAEIARRARFHVIASTGFFVYPGSPSWMKTASRKEMIHRWKEDVLHGMDGTGIRAGVLKGASGLEIRDRRRSHGEEIRQWFEALAQTHRETGLPITTHGMGPVCWHQFEILTRCGVPPRAIALGHADSLATFDHLQPVVDRGGFVLLNFCAGFRAPWYRRELKLIKALIDHGYVEQLLLSVDAVYKVSRRWGGIEKTKVNGKKAPWARDYRHAFTRVVPDLKRRGVTDRQLRQVFVHNPKIHLAGPW